MKKNWIAVCLSLLLSLLAIPASADELTDAQAYVRKQNDTITALLKQPVSKARDTQITGVLEGYIDHDEMVARAFGAKCPTGQPEASCDRQRYPGIWEKLTEAQKTEARDLLKRLIEKNYKKNLIKTLDFDISYKGAREGKVGESRVTTQAKKKNDPYADTYTVVYHVQPAGAGTFRIIDIVTENSSLTKNYYDQFFRLHGKGGFALIADKLKDRIAKKD